MDHFVGLNFSANFNFALVGHLLKGKAVCIFPLLTHVLSFYQSLEKPLI